MPIHGKLTASSFHFCLYFNLFLAVETILLAFQNYILMLGTSVMIPALLVPAMGGTDVSLFFDKLPLLLFSLATMFQFKFN